MPTERAIDKLKKAFSIANKSSYPIYKDGELIVKVYWTPLTIADRDQINNTLKALNKGDEEGSLDFALQVILTKAQDEEGKKLTKEFLDRVNKFNIKDKYLPEFNVVAWSDLKAVRSLNNE